MNKCKVATLTYLDICIEGLAGKTKKINVSLSQPFVWCRVFIGQVIPLIALIQLSFIQ